jgi:hypothetical protein
MLQWLNRCSQLTRSTIGPTKDYTEVNCQTLFAFVQGSKPPRGIPLDPIRGLQSHIRLLAKVRDFGLLDDESTLEPGKLEVGESTLAYLGKIWRGRVIFSTMQGMIGMGDRGIEVGDSVCLFFGLSSMYILRALDGMYSFKSEAYIHGLMVTASSALGTLQEDFRPPEKTKIFGTL